MRCRCLGDEAELPILARAWYHELARHAAASGRDRRETERAPETLAFVFTGRLPEEGEATADERRIVWVDEGMPSRARWAETVRAWRPWRVLVSHLPGEGNDEVPEDLRSRLVWLPVLVPALPPAPIAAPAKSVVVLIDTAKPVVVRWSSPRCGRTDEEGLRWTDVAEHVGAGLDVEVLDAGEALSHPAVRARVTGAARIVSAVLDEGIAHALRKLADQNGAAFCNLVCSSASPLRGLGGPVLNESGIRGIREVVAPLLQPVDARTRGGRDVTPSDSESWLAFLAAEAGGTAAAAGTDQWENLHCLLRAGAPRLRPAAARLALGLRIAAREPGLSDAIAALAPDDAGEPWVRRFLREWPAPDWTQRFTELWHAVPGWTDLCARAAEVLASGRVTPSPRGRAASGLFRGVCGQFATGWRRAWVEQAVAWWARDRAEGAVGADAREEEILARSALGQVEEVEALLEAESAASEPLGSRAAGALLRELMPAIEQGRPPEGTSTILSAARRWIERDRERGRDGPAAIGAELLVENYAGNYPAVLEHVARHGPGEWAPVAALYLWLAGAEDEARRCLELVNDADRPVPATRLLPLAAAHALVGNPERSANLLRELHPQIPRLMHPGGPVNLRWFSLAAALRALGAEENATRWRERARRCHPQGEDRDWHWPRIVVRARHIALPDFAPQQEDER